MLSDTLYAAEIVENQITRITALDPQIKKFSWEQNLLNENFILTSVTNLNTHKTSFNFAKDLNGSTKLLNSDQIDLIREKAITQNIKYSDLNFFKENFQSAIKNNELNKNAVFKVSNISHILLKPTILITKLDKENNQSISYVFLSDFLSQKTAINTENNFLLVNINGDLIANLNTGQVIFTNNIGNTKSFKRIVNVNVESGLFIESDDSDEKLVSYSKIKNLDLIIVNFSRMQYFNENINLIKKKIFLLSFSFIALFEAIIVIALFLKRDGIRNI